MKTKARILAAALDLFNQQGTNAVSTNHIADAQLILVSHVKIYQALTGIVLWWLTRARPTA